MSQDVPVFQSERLQISKGREDGLCYDQSGNAVAVVAQQAYSENFGPTVFVCLSEAKLIRLSPSELNKQISALLAFGVATSHGYSQVNATKVQAYVLQKVQ